jgi:hypothetical protein
MQHESPTKRIQQPKAKPKPLPQKYRHTNTVQAQRQAQRSMNTPSEHERLFDAIMGEIEERKVFLSELRRLKNLDQKTEQRIKLEIRERLDELKRLDRLLSH